MKIPKYIRRKRRLEALGDSRLLRRLTHQAYVLTHGAQDSRYLLAKRLISRYETFRQLILSRREARDKTQTGLQFTFRLPSYIQNIENKPSVQQNIYSSLKNIYELPKSTIHYVIFRSSKNILLLNKTEHNNKYFIINENLISNTNKLIKSILINNILSNTNISDNIHNTKKSLYSQPLQYRFAYSEISTNPHILIPSNSLETSELTSSRDLQYVSKNLKIANANSPLFNRQNYRLDTQKIFKHVFSSQYGQFDTNYDHTMQRNSLETSELTLPRELQYVSKNLKIANVNSSLFNRQNTLLDTQEIFKYVLSSQYDRFYTNYYHTIQSQMQKKYLENYLVKFFNYQIGHNYTGSEYTNLSNVINKYRFDDHITSSYRQRHRSIQNAQHRSPIRSYNLSQKLSTQRILRPHIHQRVHAQTEISNLLGRASHVVHAYTLHPAFSTPQPSDQVTRERATIQYTEPEITHKRQIGMQQKSREEQGDAPNEPAVSFHRTVKPLGIAEPPQSHRSFNIDDLANQVMQKMADKLKTEQERRGIFV